jgi:hypothetical protein
MTNEIGPWTSGRTASGCVVTQDAALMLAHCRRAGTSWVPLMTSQRPRVQEIRKMRRRVLEFTLMLVLLFVGPRAWADTSPQPADDEPSDVAVVWFDTLYDVVKSEATAFPEASRIYGISAVAIYEAVVPGTPDNRSLVVQVDGLASVPQPKEHQTYHWPAVANAALARTISGIFPSLKPKSMKAINASEQRFAAQFQAEVEEKDYQRAVVQGQRVAETGIDMAPLGTAARLAAWDGVAPGNDESAGKQRFGRTRQGNQPLRTALTPLAHAAAHTKGTYLSALYHRLAARRGRKRAIVAVAHSVVVSAFYMFVRQEPYHKLGATYFDEQRQHHVVDRLMRGIEQLGYHVHLEPRPSTAS